MTELHSIFVQVNILAVKLHVRFPCRLAFQLKSQTSAAQSKLDYDIRNGECEVGEELQSKEEVPFDGKRGQYSDYEMKLFIQMKSNNGIIPAGHVTFSLSKHRPLQRNVQTLPLEKCPDKNATITFELEIQFLQKIERINQFDFDSNSHVESLKDMSGSHIIEVANCLAVSREKVARKSPSNLSHYSRNATQKEESVRIRNPQEFTQSHVKTYGYEHRNLHTFSKDFLHPQSYVRPSAYRLQFNDELEELRSVRHIDTQEKSNFIKEIGKLKGQLRSMKIEDKMAQNSKIKEENRVLTYELDKVRQKLKLCERKQHETAWSLKDVKEELQRSKARNGQIEASKKDLEAQLEKKQKTCKQLQAQAKKLIEKVEEVTSKLSALHKKSEYKENLLHEQIKTLNEKYISTESQRKKQTYESHALLAKLQESERKGQANLKERQRNHLEEKGKLTKSIETLTQQIGRYKQIMQQKQLQNQQNISKIKNYSERQAQLQTAIQSLETKENTLILRLKQQEQEKSIREKEIQDYKSIESQRNTYRRKNQELSQTNGQLTEKLGLITCQKERCDVKIKEIEALLSDKLREVQEFVTKLNKSNKQLQTCKKNQTKLLKQVQNLSSQNQNNLKKYNQLKAKYDSEGKEAGQIKTKTQERINYLSKIREYRDNEIEQQKTVISKNIAQIEQLNNRLKASNVNILQLNQQIINLQKENRRLIQEESEKNDQLESLRLSNTQSIKREKNLNESLKKNTQTLFEYEKQLKTQGSQLSILTQSHKVQISKCQEIIQQRDQVLKEKERQLSSRTQQIPNLNYQIRSNEEAILIKDHQLSQKNQQIQTITSQTNALRLQLSNKEKQNAQLLSQIQDLSQKIVHLEQQLTKISLSHHQAQQLYVKVKEQWNSYHTSTRNAIERLLQELSRDDSSNSTKYSLQNFQDETLSIMQVQLIKKKNQTASIYNTKILQLQGQKSMAEMQLAQLKKRTTQREEELERLILTNRENSKATILTLQKEKEQLMHKQQQKDMSILELKSEVQKKSNELHKAFSDIEQLTEEIGKIKEQKQLQSNQIRALQRQIIDIKSHQISYRPNSYGRAYEEKQIKINKLKSIIEERQRNMSELVTKNSAKDKTIKLLENQIQELMIEIDGKKQQLQSIGHTNHKYREEKQIIEKRYNSLQQEHKQLQNIIQTEKQRNAMQNLKVEQLENIRSQTYNHLTESLVQNEQLKASIVMLESINNQGQSKIRQQQSKYTSIIDSLSKEVNALKEKCIEFASANELKDFQISQLQSSNTSIKEELQQLKQDYDKKRKESIFLGVQIEELRNQRLYNAQAIDILSSQKKHIQGQASILREKVAAYELQLELAQEQMEKTQAKHKQLQLEKQKLLNLLAEYERNEEAVSLPIKGSLSTVNFRRNTMALSKVGQEKKRIRQLQQLLESRHVDVALERKKLLRELQREKRAYMNEINYLTSQVNSLQHELTVQSYQVPEIIVQEQEYYEMKEKH